jgi:hypothetical protein
MLATLTKKRCKIMDNSGIEKEILRYNYSPLEKLSGLTPTQTHELIHGPDRADMSHPYDSADLQSVPAVKRHKANLIAKKDN